MLRVHCARAWILLPISPGARSALRVAVVTETYPPEINGVARTVGLMVGGAVRARARRPAHSSAPAQRAWPRRTDGPDERLVPGLADSVLPPPADGVRAAAAAPQGMDEVAARCRARGHRGTARLGGGERRESAWASRSARTSTPTSTATAGTTAWACSPGSCLALPAGICTTAPIALWCPTAEMQVNLEALAFERVRVVGRGVDTWLFSPARRSERLRATLGLPRKRDGRTVRRAASRRRRTSALFVEAALAMRAIDTQPARGSRRGRSAGRRAARAAPRFRFRGNAHRRRSGRALRLGGRVPLSQHHRDVRQRDARGDGERPGGGRIRLCRRAPIPPPRSERACSLRWTTARPSSAWRSGSPRIGISCRACASEARRAAEGASWSRAFDDLERVLRSIIGAESRGARLSVSEDSVHVET